ncbi:flavin reductase family protein [Psychrobacillus sp. NEAU-3TGS]|uniref:flavin reductase family protein n=1 Tax=Psychrobacillus sp. NEAU-3TGS TaxID=2995412 RepID=UPI0024973C9A|nr:flavin reductase family protein [Psychrobacillus sp. NEAU-3TGS]MDI2589473.1 flavin reductase family protein [Psychrobacillus sp. NEAU-3TGS]
MVSVNVNVGSAQDEFKKALGNYPTGVTVVTTFDQANNPVGLTVNSFASVSLDPLLILWSIDKKSGSYPVFIEAEKFTVNILADDQADICSLFASKVENRFSQCEWEESARHLPVLSGSLAQLECKTAQQIDAGDHIIFIGEVIHIHNEDKNPLLYHKRNFGAIPDNFYKNK